VSERRRVEVLVEVELSVTTVLSSDDSPMFVSVLCNLHTYTLLVHAHLLPILFLCTYSHILECSRIFPFLYGLDKICVEKVGNIILFLHSMFI